MRIKTERELAFKEVHKNRSIEELEQALYYEEMQNKIDWDLYHALSELIKEKRRD